MFIHANCLDRDYFNHTGTARAPSGFTLIELMIVVAIIAIILALALPVYSNYTIRTKVAEGLSVSAAAKTAASNTCQADPEIPALSAARAGYNFVPTVYVQSVEISGPCSAPVITVRTQNTGATNDPVLILTGDPFTNSGRFLWTCTTESGQNILVPKACRS